MSLDELRNGTYWTEKVEIEWLAEGESALSRQAVGMWR